jgi:hypothetical protein
LNKHRTRSNGDIGSGPIGVWDVGFRSLSTAHIKPLLQVIGTDAMKFHWPLNTDALQDSLGTAITSVLANKQKPEDALRDAEKSDNAARE